MITNILIGLGAIVLLSQGMLFYRGWRSRRKYFAGRKRNWQPVVAKLVVIGGAVAGFLLLPDFMPEPEHWKAWRAAQATQNVVACQAANTCTGPATECLGPWVGESAGEAASCGVGIVGNLLEGLLRIVWWVLAQGVLNAVIGVFLAWRLLIVGRKFTERWRAGRSTTPATARATP